MIRKHDTKQREEYVNVWIESIGSVNMGFRTIVQRTLHVKFRLTFQDANLAIVFHLCLFEILANKFKMFNSHEKLTEL